MVLFQLYECCCMSNTKCLKFIYNKKFLLYIYVCILQFLYYRNGPFYIHKGGVIGQELFAFLQINVMKAGKEQTHLLTNHKLFIYTLM